MGLVKKVLAGTFVLAALSGCSSVSIAPGNYDPVYIGDHTFLRKQEESNLWTDSLHYLGVDTGDHMIGGRPHISLIDGIKRDRYIDIKKQKRTYFSIDVRGTTKRKSFEGAHVKRGGGIPFNFLWRSRSY